MLAFLCWERMEKLWFWPCGVWAGGPREYSSWLDGMLGDALLNCFDRCAVKVSIKNLSLLKYTSESHPIKYRCSVQYVCNVRTVRDTMCVFPWSVGVAFWGMADMYSVLFTSTETTLGYLFKTYGLKVGIKGRHDEKRRVTIQNGSK